MKMKMWIGNLDGRRAGLVISSSKEKARKIVGAGKTDFDDYWVLQPAVDESLEFEVLYTMPTRARISKDGKWQQGKCPL